MFLALAAAVSRFSSATFCVKDVFLPNVTSPSTKIILVPRRARSEYCLLYRFHVALKNRSIAYCGRILARHTSWLSVFMLLDWTSFRIRKIDWKNWKIQQKSPYNINQNEVDAGSRETKLRNREWYYTTFQSRSNMRIKWFKVDMTILVENGDQNQVNRRWDDIIVNQFKQGGRQWFISVTHVKEATKVIRILTLFRKFH